MARKYCFSKFHLVLSLHRSISDWSGDRSVALTSRCATLLTKDRWQSSLLSADAAAVAWSFGRRRRPSSAGDSALICRELARIL